MASQGHGVETLAETCTYPVVSSDLRGAVAHSQVSAKEAIVLAAEVWFRAFLCKSVGRQRGIPFVKKQFLSWRTHCLGAFRLSGDGRELHFTSVHHAVCLLSQHGE